MSGRSNTEYDSSLGGENHSLRCNIYKRQCKIVIPRGYEICHNCHGVGCFYVSAHFKQRHVTVIKCPICLGTGCVDWITRIRGKKLEFKDISGHTLKMKKINFRCNMNGCKVIKRWARKRGKI